MARQLTIAIDGMGGDLGAENVVAGVDIARGRFPNCSFLLAGDETEIAPLVEAAPRLSGCVEIIHTDKVIASSDAPAQALRRGRGSSMGLAIRSVRDGKADVAVSAGNTGALMAMSKFMLKTMEGISRPALASLVPTTRGECVMLDLGANVECDVDNLVQFAVMGAAFSRVLLGLDRPRVGLLNIGVEELKGNERIRMAGQILRDAPLPMEFAGFTEGDRIGQHDVDVVVTDGFTGNVALKTAEGTARLISDLLREAFQANLFSKLGYLIARRGLSALKDHLDPNNHNGGVFLGLNGLVVKSHGSANAKGIATAIGTAIDLAAADLGRRISDDLNNFKRDATDIESNVHEIDSENQIGPNDPQSPLEATGSDT